MTRPEYLSARECERQWRNTHSLVERTFRSRRARREPFVRYFGRTRFRLFYPPLRSTVFPPHFFPYQVLSKMNYSSYFYAVANARNFVLHHCFKYTHALYHWYILSLIRFLNKANIFTSTYIGLRIYLMPLSISFPTLIISVFTIRCFVLFTFSALALSLLFWWGLRMCPRIINRFIFLSLSTFLSLPFSPSLSLCLSLFSLFSYRR